MNATSIENRAGSLMVVEELGIGNRAPLSRLDDYSHNTRTLHGVEVDRLISVIDVDYVDRLHTSL